MRKSCFTVTIKHEYEDKLINLYHAFQATHNQFSHDEDVFIVQNDKSGAIFMLRASIGYIRIGDVSATEAESFWTENVPPQDVYRLFISFIREWYEEIEQYECWENIGQPLQNSAGNPPKSDE